MKILYITTIGGTMSFFKSLIKKLIDDGNIVDIATNETYSKVADCYKEWGCNIFQISTSRSPFDLGNIKAIKEIRTIVKNYDIVHCHTPLAGMAARFACKPIRKNGLKVIYTAHGFHFYKGAPLKNWLIYYPVEWICAHWTDVLITINKEDFERAKKHMPAKKVEYVPGVGIDIGKFANTAVDRKQKRVELGIPEDAFLILSVGELNENKNHKIVIEAISKIKNNNIHYAIVGKGELEKSLKEFSEKFGVGNNVHLLGFRMDVADLYKIADLYVHPSFREGLPVALMEAIASKLNCICSDIRGCNDLVKRGLFDPKDVNSIKDAILRFFDEDNYIENYMKLRTFDLSCVDNSVKFLYEDETGGVLTYLSRIIAAQSIRRRERIPFDDFEIVSVGELNENKNHQVIIEAISKLEMKKRIHYVIAGVGNQKESLEKLAQALEVNLHLLGYRDDIPALYNSADVCAFPSIREGLGMAALEGMASGLPLICSDNRGTRSYASKSNAIICEAGDAHAFAKAIRTIIENSQLSQMMGETSKTIINDFSISCVEERMMNLYNAKIVLK